MTSRIPKTKKARPYRLVAVVASMLFLALFLHVPAAMAATPGGVTSPTLWLRADRGASASSWTDQSTNANNATQGTGANQPAPTDNATNNINFNPVMLFDGTNDFMNLDITKMPTGTGARTFACVAQYNADPNATAQGHYILGWGSDNAASQAQGVASLSSDLYYVGGGNDVIKTSFWQQAKPAYVMGTWAGSGGAANLYADSALVGGPTNKSWNTGAEGARVGFLPWGTTQHWVGPISECSLFNRVLSATERQQINSYLSIKYGFTIDQASATNYLASDGTTVLWDATTNATYKNRITSIGRDDTSDLTQKQSKSTETGSLVTIGNGDTIAATNNANGSSFSADKSFLTVGDDNGSTGATTLVSGTSDTRIGRIWKAQETGTVGSVKIQIPASNLPGSSPVLIRSTDTTFNSSDTLVPLTVNGTNYEATIDLNNGDFFTFASLRPVPGGVSNNLNLWVKADTGVVTSGSNVTTWQDQYGPNTTFATSGTAPTYPGASNINFNPVVSFGGAGKLVGDTSITMAEAFSVNLWNGAINTERGTIVSPTNNTGGGGSQYFLRSASDSTLYTGVNPPNYISTTPPPAGEVDLWDSGGTNIFRKNGLSVVTGTTGASMTGIPQIGDRSSNDSKMKGDIAETIVYGANPTSTERSQIQSYLAVKYGITLDQTSPTNYLASDGTTVTWDATTNGTYKNRITGIGRDDLSGLTQKQSKSVASGGLITIGNGNTIAADNASNGSTFSADKSFLVAGDDNSATTPTTLMSGTINTRIGRTWKVQETGTVGSVKVQIPASTLSGSLPELVRSTDTTFDSSDTHIPLTVNGSNLEATIDLNSGDFFTFASLIPSPGGVSGESLWTRADLGTSSTTDGAALSTWSDQSLQQNDATQGTAANQPLFKDNSTNNINFNPVISFNGTSHAMVLDITKLPTGTGPRTLASMAMMTDITATGYTMAWGTANSTNNGQGITNSGANPGELHYIGWANDMTSAGFWQNNAPNYAMGTWAGSAGAANLYGKNKLLAGPTNKSWNTGTANGARIGVFPGVASSNWKGTMAENMVYPRALTTAERQQVDSYMAVKYGFNIDQTSATNYLASDGTTVLWDATTNATYKNRITAIGRDDLTALTQKQSKSIETGSLVTIGNGNTITATNSANGSTFSADRSYLIFGDDNGSTAPTTRVTGTNNTRMTRVWKAQESGSVGSVKIQIPASTLLGSSPVLLRSTDSTFDNSDTSVPMTVNGSNYEANIDLNNGDFFSFGSFIPAPGGIVNGLQTWQRADDGVSTNAAWQDSGPNGNTASQATAANQPVAIAGSAATAANFNPGFKFDGSNDYMDIANGLGFNANNPLTLFGVGNRQSAGTVDGFLAQPPGNAGDMMWGYGSDNQAWFTNTSGIGKGTGVFSTTNVPRMLSITRGNGGVNNFDFYANGGSDGSITQALGINAEPTTRIGSRQTTGGDTPDMVISEIAVYNRTLSATELRQVHSYESIKYGLTLDQTSAQNYLDSGSNVVWNATTNAAYKNNITGIGRDDLTLLNQKQSKSVNTSSLVTMGNGNTIAADNAGNGSSFSADRSYLIFGDDNGALSWTTTGAPANRSKLVRTFKAATTGTINSVKVQVPDNSSTLATELPGEGTAMYLLVDADGDFSSGATEIPMTQSGTSWEADATLANQFFTFATATTPPDMTAATDSGTSNTDNITNDSTPTFTGACNNGETISLLIDGTPVAPTQVCASSTYTITPSSPIAEGNRTVASSSSTGLVSETLSFTIDTTPPAALTAPDMTAATDSGTSNTDDITNDSTPDFTGACTTGETTTFLIDAVAITQFACVGGAYTVTPASAVADGAHVATATTTDVAGNTSSPSPALNFTIDTVAPAAPVITSPTTGTATNDDTPTISGTGENGATVTVTDQSSNVICTTTVSGGTWSCAPSSALPDNTYTFKASQTDVAGNTSPQSNNVTVTVDTAAPTAPVIAAPTDGSSTNDTTPTITGTGEPNATLHLVIDGGAPFDVPVDAFGDWTFTPASPLANGSHTLQATQTDSGSNTSPASAVTTFTIDITALGVTVDQKAGQSDPTAANSIFFTVVFSKPINAATFGAGDISIGTAPSSPGTYIATFTQLNATTWEFEVKGMANDTTVTATIAADVAQDLAGNNNLASTSTDNSVLYQVPPPNITPQITNDTTPTLTGQCGAAGNNIQLDLSGPAAHTYNTTCDGTSNWSFNVPDVLPQGTYDVVVTDTDAVVSNPVANQTSALVVDTATPTVTANQKVGQPDPTNVNSATFTITFNENMNAGSFVSGDLSLTGTSGTVTTLTQMSTTVWEATVTGMTSGDTVTMTLPAGQVNDLAGNSNAVSTSTDNQVTYDNTPPAAPVITAPANGSSTADNTPTITGTGENGATITVSIDGGSIACAEGTVVVSGGTWMCTPTTPLADGGHTITALQTDAALNNSAQSSPVTVTIDTAAPTALAAPDMTAATDSGSSNSDNLTNDTTPNFTGTCVNGDTVTIYSDGSPIGSQVCSGSAYTITANTPLSDGPRAITATATDSTGNVSPASPALNITVDTTAPATPTAPDMTAATDSGSSNTDNITNDSTPDFTGACTTGETVIFYIDSVLDNQQVCPVSGTYAFTASAPLGEGTHIAQVMVTDQAGNASALSSSLNFTVDTTAPSAPVVTSPADGSSTNDTTPTITGTGENGATVTVSVDGSPITCAGAPVVVSGGTWTCTPTVPLAEGGYTVTASQTDVAGNASPSSNASTITVDTTSPATPAAPDMTDTTDSGASNTDDLTNDSTPDFTGSCVNGETVTVYADGSPVGVQACSGGTYTITASTLADGAHNMTVTAIDSAGNTSVQSSALTITVDTSANPPVITSPASGQPLSNSTPTFTGTGDVGQTIIVTDESGSVLCATTVDGGGNWSCVSAISLTSDAHTFTATQTDNAGNSSAISVTTGTTPAPTPTPTPTPTALTPAPAAVVTLAPAPADVDGDSDGVPDGVDQCLGTAAGATVTANGCPTNPSQLFDIRLLLDDASIASIKELIGRVTFTSFGSVPTPIDMTFSIIDANGNVVWQAEIPDNTVIETEGSYLKRFSFLGELPDGDYTLKLHTKYNRTVEDDFTAAFTIGEPAPFCWILVWTGGQALLAIGFGLAYRHQRRSHNSAPHNTRNARTVK